MGVYVYIASLALPFASDIPLVVLAGCSLVVLARSSSQSLGRSPLALPVLLFLGAAALSIALSADVRRSVSLSTPLPPGALVFFLIAGSFRSIRQTQLLYLVWAIVGLSLSCLLLWATVTHGWVLAHTRIAATGSPMLVEPNDVILLALIAPMSIALIAGWPALGVRTLAVVSLLSSAWAIAAVQSRGGILTLCLSSTVATVLLRPRLGAWCGVGILTLALMFDTFAGLPLLAKFARLSETRVSLWLAAWAMFLDAPWFGHGTHTFRLFYRSYLDQLTLPAWLPVDHRVAPWAHNLYLEALAEQGLVGFAALAFLLVVAARLAWALPRTAARDARALGAAALAALAGFIFAAAFELTFLRHWVVIMLFAILGVIAQLSRR